MHIKKKENPMFLFVRHYWATIFAMSGLTAISKKPDPFGVL
jgi:hypothetical protein